MNAELLLQKTQKELQYADLYKILCGIIMEAYQYCGQRLKGENEAEKGQELKFQTENLISDIADVKYKKFTIQDIKFAFKNGLKGEYGEWMGLNNKTYNQWLKGFLENRKSALVHTSPKQIEYTLSQQEIEKIQKDAVITCYALWQRTGEIFDRGNASYNYLWDRGLLRFDEETWGRYLEAAKSLELARANEVLKKAKLRFDKITVLAAHTELEQLEKGEDSSIKILARKLALSDYFKSL